MVTERTTDGDAVEVDAFAQFVIAREQLRRWSEAGDQPALSDTEERVRQGIAPLWDADRGTILQLRRYGERVSGARPEDYDRQDPEIVRQLEPELQRLLEYGDPALWVDEPSALGGFGLTRDGRHYNEDTLRFFRIVSLLDEAGVLKGLRSARMRRTVWEIGGGWGGLAYHMRRLCPSVTYLMTGRADTSLLAATYLMTLCPDARVRFFDPRQPARFWDDWDAVDVAFAPESIVRTMVPPSLDLMVDVMALEQMTAERIESHAERAYTLDCRHVLSVCPAADPEPGYVRPVLPSLERWYWPHPMAAAEYAAKRFAVRRGKRAGPVRRAYFLGWRRLLPQGSRVPRLRAPSPEPRVPMKDPKVVCGMPAHRRSDTLPRALESLLSQTYADFALVIVDDSPADEIETIVDRYRSMDRLPRVHYERNEARLALVDNWRKVFARARELYPGSEYFAWVSDHDVWNARWLEELVSVLDTHPDVVLAYPETFRIFPDGGKIERKAFGTFGIERPEDRIRTLARQMIAGDMIYGLMRARALERAGVFRRVITPDRQALLALSVFGQVKQVPEVLWYREVLRPFDVQRQREVLFRNGTPLHAFLPSHLQHFGTLAWDLAVRGAGRPIVGRMKGLRCAAIQLWESSLRQLLTKARPNRRFGKLDGAAPA